MENLPNPKQILEKLFAESLSLIAPDELNVAAEVKPCNDPGHGDYQCNNAMGLFKALQNKLPGKYENPRAVGQAIMDNLPHSDIIERSSIAGPGYVNVVLSRRWIETRIHNLLVDGIETWAPKLPVGRAVVDFSSPNIAKEMHVGHLRSTVIGDSLARMLEFCNVEVLRRNHVGDWGTQFGMLIENLFEQAPDNPSHSIADLQKLYKESKKRFDKDPGFKERAQKAVVSLQGGDERYRKKWSEICEMSRQEFEKVYERLNVRLEEKGESFYSPYIPRVLELLTEMIVEDDGARVIWVEGFKKQPLMVVKSDGGYNYDSTDLAALWYRIHEEKAELIVYVTDIGQSQHFQMLFAAAKRAKWLPENDVSFPKAVHVGFGLVSDETGKKIQTRASEGVTRLVDLLDEAKKKSKEAITERAVDWTEAELDAAAEAVGYGAVKYADLKNNIATNYRFSFDQMLNDKGNTAVYILYAHARISSIIRKSGKDIDELVKNGGAGKMELDHPDERVLGLHLARFSEVVREACADMAPNKLCEYLYGLADLCTKFYTQCKVNGSAEETSRLLLCEATAVVMRKCFHLLGITPVYKL